MERTYSLKPFARLAPRLLVWLAWCLCALTLSLQPVILALAAIVQQEPWRLLYMLRARLPLAAPAA